MHTLRLAPLALMLLAGCSDTGLRLAPGPSADNPSPAAGGPSPWDALDDDLELPDEHFVVAWSTPEEGRWTPSRIDLIDVLGSVVGNYEHPGWVADNGTYLLDDFDWTELRPAAPGTVLVDQYRTFNEGDVGGVEEHDRVVWNLDLVTEEWRLDAQIAQNQTLFLPATDRTIESPPGTVQLHIVADATDRNALWLVYESYLLNGGPWTLRRVDLTGATETATWSSDDLYAADLPSTDRFRSIVASAGASHDGEPVIALAGFTTPPDIPEDAPHIWQVHAFGADGQVDWNITIPIPPGDAVPRSMESVSGELADLTSTLQGQTGDYGCWAREFALVDDDQWWTVATSEAFSCPRPGPLLDPANHTFVGIGVGPEDEELFPAGAPEEIFVSHRGAEVWSIDTFRLGLTETDFRLHSLLRVD